MRTMTVPARWWLISRYASSRSWRRPRFPGVPVGAPAACCQSLLAGRLRVSPWILARNVKDRDRPDRTRNGLGRLLLAIRTGVALGCRHRQAIIRHADLAANAVHVMSFGVRSRTKSGTDAFLHVNTFIDSVAIMKVATLRSSVHPRWLSK
jgi:hypothetical protein